MIHKPSTSNAAAWEGRSAVPLSAIRKPSGFACFWNTDETRSIVQFQFSTRDFPNPLRTCMEEKHTILNEKCEKSTSFFSVRTSETERENAKTFASVGSFCDMWQETCEIFTNWKHHISIMSRVLTYIDFNDNRDFPHIGYSREPQLFRI